MDRRWRYVSKEGNPDKEGIYLTVLIHDEWRDSKPTGRQLATIDTRFFCDADREGMREWAMNDQPEYGLIWTQETGSGANERVLCWMPQEYPDDIVLPEGVEWEY